MIYTTLLSKLYQTVYGNPADVAEGPGSGLVLMADGVGGLDLCGTSLRYEAAAQGGPHQVKVIPWGHGFGKWLADLSDVDNHAKNAEDMARRVEEWRAGKPNAPAFLVGKSGGTGLVVKALELLPENSVETAVLLSPAISPRYDLTRALRAIRKELVVFWSPLDVIVLGLGTLMFKTVDRVRSVSAGMVGFRTDVAKDEDGRKQYAKLRQVRWRPEMIPTGYCGGHVGPDSPAFLRKYVLPLLTTEEPSPEGFPSEVKTPPDRADNHTARRS